jgi:HK97 family phage prohead protease
MDFEKLCQLFLQQLGKQKDGGQTIVRRSLGVSFDVKAIDEKARTVRVLASSDSIDSYGDIVDQKSFLLERYKKNPVVLYGHNNVGVFGMGGAPEWTLPVGFSTDFGVGADGLETTLNFVDGKASPMAPFCWQGFLQGSIRAVSIGFYPHRVEVEPKADEAEDEDDVYRLSENELFEISVVPIGANPDAVVLEAQRKAERAWFKQRAANDPGANWLRKTISIPIVGRAPAPPADHTTKTPAAPAAQEQSTMTAEEQKKLENELAESKKALEAKEAELKAAKEAGEAEATKAAGEAEARAKTAEERAKKLELEAQEREVSDLVGKKITPAQKAAFVKLRALSPELFSEITKGMSDLVETKTLTPPDPDALKNKATSKKGTSTVTQRAREAADKASGEAA